MFTAIFQPLRILTLFCSVHGLKSIGYVQLQFSYPTPAGKPKGPQTRSASIPEPSSRPAVAIGLAVLALFAAIAVPYLYK